MDKEYWDSQKQYGVAVLECGDVSLMFNLDAWNEERQGDGSVNMERIICGTRLDADANRIIDYLSRAYGNAIDEVYDYEIQRLFNKYEYNPLFCD